MAAEESYTRKSVIEGQDAVSMSRREGAYVLNKFAYRDDIDTADGDALIIADNTTNTPTILTSASTFTIAYNNTTDGDGTNGALSLLITYLDSDEDETTGIHTLGSSGSDVTSFSGLGINRIVVLSSGSTQANGNDITVTATTGGSVQVRSISAKYNSKLPSKLVPNSCALPSYSYQVFPCSSLEDTYLLLRPIPGSFKGSGSILSETRPGNALIGISHGIS